MILTKNKVIGFVGAGNMANSLIRGMLASGANPELLWAADINAEKLTELAEDYKIQKKSAAEIARGADVVVLAVKPQVMKMVCQSLAPDLQAESLVISIAAGVTASHLENWLGGAPAIVRCMPNTPALVGKGTSGLFANAAVSTEQRQLATDIIAAVGVTLWVEQENLIDAVTAVSGSGPAYFFLFMEAMEATAQELGLSADAARLLTLNTALGAAELALGSSDSTAELRRKVTSPGGTTEQAINRFEAGDLRTLVDTAMNAARIRSEELAKELT